MQIDAEILLKQLQQKRKRWGAVEPVPDQHLDGSRPEATGAILSFLTQCACWLGHPSLAAQYAALRHATLGCAVVAYEMETVCNCSSMV